MFLFVWQFYMDECYIKRWEGTDIGFLIGNYEHLELENGVVLYRPSDFVLDNTHPTFYSCFYLNTPCIKIPFRFLTNLSLVLSSFDCECLDLWANIGKAHSRYSGRGPVSFSLRDPLNMYTPYFTISKLSAVGFSPSNTV